MTLFQIILLLAAAFFAYQVYMHIQNIDEDAEPIFGQEPEQIEIEPTADERIEEADRAYMDGDIARAQTLLEETVNRFPDLPEAMNKLAFILAKQGNAEAAEEQYRASLAIAPNDDMTHNALATVLVSLSKEGEAEEHYKKAKGKHINIIVAGHISSDNIGLNLLLDKVQKKGKLDILACSGFRRVER